MKKFDYIIYSIEKSLNESYKKNKQDNDNKKLFKKFLKL